MHQTIDIITKNSPHLDWMKNNTIFLTQHGSKAYNTNVATSDDDYKGVCIPPFDLVASFHKKFEQAELRDPNPDTVIYEIRKFFNLAAANNPSIIEVLFTDPSYHFICTDVGEKMVEKRDIFLSKRARFSFSGYAIAQLKRIKLHRQYLLNPPKQYPTRKEMGLPERTLIPKDKLDAANSLIRKELERYEFHQLELSESDKVFVKNTIFDMLAELKCSKEDQWMSAAKKIGLDDNFIYLMQQEKAYQNKKDDWDKYQNWKKNRNIERAGDEEKYGYDCKHAYHLVRLIRMCKEIMTTGKVIVKRPDREELLLIRNGGWSYEQVVEYAERIDKELEEIYNTSNILPKSPNMNAIDKLCVEMIEMQWRK